MFKLAFPWAKHAEEAAERNHIKTFPATSQDEIAGNVWVQESFGKHSQPVSAVPCSSIASSGTRQGLRDDALDHGSPRRDPYQTCR